MDSALNAIITSKALEINPRVVQDLSHSPDNVQVDKALSPSFELLPTAKMYTEQKDHLEMDHEGFPFNFSKLVLLYYSLIANKVSVRAACQEQ